MPRVGDRRRLGGLGEERPVLRSRSLRIFRTTTGLVWRLFAIASEVVPRRRVSDETHDVDGTRLRLFAVITVTIPVIFKAVKLG